MLKCARRKISFVESERDTKLLDSWVLRFKQGVFNFEI